MIMNILIELILFVIIGLFLLNYNRRINEIEEYVDYIVSLGRKVEQLRIKTKEFGI